MLKINFLCNVDMIRSFVYGYRNAGVIKSLITFKSLEIKYKLKKNL